MVVVAGFGGTTTVVDTVMEAVDATVDVKVPSTLVIEVVVVLGTLSALTHIFAEDCSSTTNLVAVVVVDVNLSVTVSDTTTVGSVVAVASIVAVVICVTVKD